MYQPGRREQIIILILAGALLFGAGVKYAQLKYDTANGAADGIPVVEQANIQLAGGITGAEELAGETFGAEDRVESQKIKVHVFGEVRRSGVYEVEEGARVIDAVEKAGPTANADLDAMSLAAPVMDGQDILVPSKKVEEGAPTSKASKVFGTAGTGTVQSSGINKGRTNPLDMSLQKVNINTATREELETLPGIGPVLAGRIVEYRQQNGRFMSLEDIKNVSGIGDAKFEQIKDKITLY